MKISEKLGEESMMRATAKLALTVLLGFVFESALVQPHSAISAAPATANSDNVVYQDWTDSARSRTIPVKLYLPQSTGPCPVVIFSHGVGGSREAAPYLGEYWSQHGYLCLFIQHPGSDTSAWSSDRGQGRQAILADIRSAANAKNAIDRVFDVKFVLDELEKRNVNDPLLKGRLKLDSIAMSGHSMGAGTTLYIAGQNTDRTGIQASDPRIKSAVYLCAPVRRNGDPKQAYGDLKIPGLFLTGTNDDSPINDTKAADRRIPFDATHAKHQYLVTFEGADHGSFGGRKGLMSGNKGGGNPKFYPEVEQLTTDFLDATLKGDRNAWSWLDTTAATYLGKDAVFEKK